LAAGFSLLAAGRNSEQIERRTSNVQLAKGEQALVCLRQIERPILMTLRFIDFKTSEPQDFKG
jgi:hypothetical protein